MQPLQPQTCDFLERRRYLVFGAARSGLAAARLLHARGHEVLLYDEGAADRLQDARAEAERIRVELTGDRDEALRRFDARDGVVLSPGVPLSHPLVLALQERGVAVRSELELGALASPAPLLAVTGTNGKTTVTHLVAHLLQTAGRRARVAGNVGHALCDVVTAPDLREPDAAIVCEVSSFQLETVERFRPRVAAVLNVTPDHLDRHVTLEAYAAAKRRITANQDAADALVLNADDPVARGFAEGARAGVWLFSLERPVERGAWLDGAQLVLSRGAGGVSPEFVLDADALPIPGRHNAANALAAVAMGAAFGLDAALMAKGLETFRPVPHRIEPVGEFRGVRYYNDSKATNLDSLEKALESFEAPIVLIAGGRDKGAPWESLRPLVTERVKALVTIGEAAGRIRESWQGAPGQGIREARSLADAVRLAGEAAAPGDVVLLSPACASFDMFRDYEDRGDRFREVVRRLAAGEPLEEEVGR